MKLKSWYPNLGGLRKQILKDFGAWSPASQMAMHTSLCVMIYIKTYSVIRRNCAICQIFTNDELRYTPVEGKALMGAITLTIEKRSQSVQSFRCAWLFVTPCTALRQASLCITNFWSLLRLMFIEFNSLQPHESQHARHPCSSLTPGFHSDSHPSSQWCHPTISSSVIPFSHLQSFPASGSFLMSQFFASGGQGIGASTTALVFLVNIQDWRSN